MLSEKQNVGTADRVVSGALGVMLGAAASYLIGRAMTGRCALMHRFNVASIGGGWPRKRDDLVIGPSGADRVDEASDLSFPASDPPAH